MRTEVRNQEAISSLIIFPGEIDPGPAPGCENVNYFSETIPVFLACSFERLQHEALPLLKGRYLLSEVSC